jgi:hypothetical protein
MESTASLFFESPVTSLGDTDSEGLSLSDRAAALDNGYWFIDADVQSPLALAALCARFGAQKSPRAWVASNNTARLIAWANVVKAQWGGEAAPWCFQKTGAERNSADHWLLSQMYAVRCAHGPSEPPPLVVILSLDRGFLKDSIRTWSPLEETKVRFFLCEHSNKKGLQEVPLVARCLPPPFNQVPWGAVEEVRQWIARSQQRGVLKAHAGLFLFRKGIVQKEDRNAFLWSFPGYEEMEGWDGRRWCRILRPMP